MIRPGHITLKVGGTLLLIHTTANTHTTTITVRPISLLTLSLLTLLDSNFPGNPLWTWEFDPFRLRLCWSQTLEHPPCKLGDWA